MIEQIPIWFWYMIAVGVFGLTALMFYGIVFFIQRYLKANDDSWKEIRGIMNDLIGITKLHEHRINENEKDIIDLHSYIRKEPKVRYKP